jgi:hypothetical protein
MQLKTVFCVLALLCFSSVHGFTNLDIAQILTSRGDKALERRLVAASPRNALKSRSSVLRLSKTAEFAYAEGETMLMLPSKAILTSTQWKMATVILPILPKSM